MKITDDQEKIMSKIREEYKNLFLHELTKNGIDKEAFEKGIKWFYSYILKMEYGKAVNKNPKIFYPDSWLSCCVIIASMKQYDAVQEMKQIFYSNIKDVKTFNNLLQGLIKAKLTQPLPYEDEYYKRASLSNIKESKDDLTYAITHTCMSEILDLWYIRDDTNKFTDEDVSIRKALVASFMKGLDYLFTSDLSDYFSDDDLMDIDILNNVSKEAIEAISNQMNSIAKTILKSLYDTFREYSSYMNSTDFGWISVYDFFKSTGKLDNKDFDNYRDIIRSGAFVIYPYMNAVFAVESPTVININDENRLHSVDGPAIKFKDGSSYYYINNRSIESWVFTEKDSMTKDKFLSIQNTETKAAIYAIQGQKKMMEILGAVMIDSSIINHKNGDEEIVELYKTIETFAEIDDLPFAWVKMICPSTGHIYLQGVEPKYNTALEAIASLSPFNPEEYSFDFRT